MTEAEFLQLAQAGEQVYVLQRLERSNVNLRAGGKTLNTPFSNIELAREFGFKHNLNPHNWLAVMNSSHYKNA